MCDEKIKAQRQFTGFLAARRSQASEAASPLKSGGVSLRPTIHLLLRISGIAETQRRDCLAHTNVGVNVKELVRGHHRHLIAELS